jgi:hypothetical protein
MPGSRPDLIAYVMLLAEVGAAWRHQNGEGVTLKIHKQMSVAGDIASLPLTLVLLWVARAVAVPALRRPRTATTCGAELLRHQRSP